MRAQFKAAKPLDVEMTLTLTAPASEWRRLKADLDRGEPGAIEIGRAVGRLISQAEASLAAETWTDGYRSGVIEPSA